MKRPRKKLRRRRTITQGSRRRTVTRDHRGNIKFGKRERP
jgi:hypothetical protein